MLRRGACPQRDAGMESVSGGFRTTATPHGRLYATDLALANPDPVGLAPAPPAPWHPRGRLGAPETHENTLFCTQLLPAAQHHPVPSWFSTPQTHGWIHSSDKSTGFRVWTHGLLLPALCIIHWRFCPALPLPPRPVETPACKQGVQQKRKKKEGNVSCSGTSIKNPISPSPLRKYEGPQQTFVV